jgi:hypothetical protein
MPRIASGLVLIALLVPPGSTVLLADDQRLPLDAPPAGKTVPARPALISRSFSKAPDVRMEVLVEGRSLPTIEHDGKTYVVVPRLGVEYEIRLSNNSSRRVVFNVAVDGLSVLNGEAASENGSGYVLSSGRDYRVKGWRRGDDKVAAFSFIKAEGSYAALTGRPEGIGTIRLIAVEEQAPVSVTPRLPIVPRRFQGNGNGSSFRSFNGGNSQSFRNHNGGSSNSAGTGYGRELSDRVGRTHFTRSTNVKRITLHYVTADDLPAGAAKDALKAHLKVEPPQPSDNFTPPPPGYQP